MSKRRVELKMMPDGNLRGFQADSIKKNGASEWMITDINNVGPSVISASPPKIIVYEDEQDE